MYIAILNDDLENARIYENLSVLNRDLNINPYTLNNFFSRNKGKFYKRGNLKVIKSPLINRRFLMALDDCEDKSENFKLNKLQKEELASRKMQMAALPNS